MGTGAPRRGRDRAPRRADARDGRLPRPADDAEDLPSVIDYARTPSPGTGGIARAGHAGYALTAPGAGLKAGLHHSGPVADPDDGPAADDGVAAWVASVGGVAIRGRGERRSGPRPACTRTRPTRASSSSATAASSSGRPAPATGSSSRRSSAARSPLSRAKPRPDFRTIGLHDARDDEVCGAVSRQRCSPSSCSSRRAATAATSARRRRPARRPSRPTPGDDLPRRLPPPRREDRTGAPRRSRPRPRVARAVARGAARGADVRGARGRPRRPRSPGGPASSTSRSRTASPRSTSTGRSTTAAAARRCSARVAQVVATLTRFPTDRAGRASVSTARTSTRSAARASSVDPPIGRRRTSRSRRRRSSSSRPLPGDTVSSARSALRGTANVFEATVSFEVRDADGNASCARASRRRRRGPERAGRSSTMLALPGPSTGPVTIVAFEASAEDGRPLHVVERSRHARRADGCDAPPGAPQAD